MENHVLNASNAALAVTNFAPTRVGTTLTGLPLGTVGASATGELGVKVLLVGASSALTLGTVTLGAGTAMAGFVGKRQLAGVPTSFAVATADGTVFTLAAGEVGFIQNLDSADTLAVKKGASASTSSFSFLLAPGAAQDDGKGGFVLIDDWVGVVSVATMSGTGRYIAWKQAVA